MSDYARDDHRMRGLAPHRSAESRALYGACYLVALASAAIGRITPWRRPAFGGRRDSIFSEAATAASVIVSSSFMGL